MFHRRIFGNTSCITGTQEWPRMFCGGIFGNTSCSTGPQECIRWSVPNSFITWSSEKKKDFYMISPSFLLKGYTWRMIAKGKEGFLGLYLWMLDHKPVTFEYRIKLGLKSHDIRANISSFVGKLDTRSSFGKWNFIDLDVLKRCRDTYGFLDFYCELTSLEDDDLSFQSEVAPSPSLHEDSAEEEHHDKPEAQGVDRLLQNFKTLLLDGQNSDVILKVENRRFPVHRLILSVRSPVFACMFQHDMTEKNSGVVDILDCSAEAFEVFLLYLYTGRAESIDQQNVFNLYYTADKYGVHDLKKECVDFMKNALSVDNFCDVITLSLHHSDSELQKAATRFFRANVKKIIRTSKWKKYLQKHPLEANELYIKAINGFKRTIKK